jgi:hypothetical protein
VRLKDDLAQLEAAVVNRPKERALDEQIWLTRFLLVRTCGYLEQVSFETARGYVQEKSGGLVRTFAMSWLERSRNPTPDNLCELVGRFDAQLRGSLESLFAEDDGRLHREICLLVDRRNRIAHGLSEGITESKAVGLKKDAETVANWFIESLSPNSYGRRGS